MKKYAILNYRNIQILLAVVLVAVAGGWLLTIASFGQAVFICVNLGAFYCYGLDKHRAIHSSQRRIPEKVLLGIAVIGGVPGSVLGQVVFRHKVRKQPFRRIFWTIAVVQVIILIYIYFGN